MPSWEEFQPFIVTGLALGGVYALSGVGMVVLYRTTGVLNLAFGAVGAMGALIAWQLINEGGWAEEPAYLVCVLFGGVVTLALRLDLRPAAGGARPARQGHRDARAGADPARRMSWIWSDKARSMILPTSTENFQVGDVLVNYTQVLGLRASGWSSRSAPLLFLRFTKLGTAMRGAGQRPRDHGHAGRAGAARRGVRVARVGPDLRRRRAAAVEPRRARRGDAHLPRDLVAGGGADRAAQSLS